ncbi:alpha/beta hydrolase (plasmid) [Shinella sp. H4-D48]|uniref:alpha/beta hydrolase n=1 Tax=Shinella sp. H4-D48 TaxID=2925841 RepID=UPI001F531554|nr:alpha/beta hydrolase [Shinella sp. H4-D48]UNK39966.1 alpha/beta hydrolase [Shinella sp. H4-D48]
MKRRTFNASILGLLCSAAAARSNDTVFLDYTQEALDKAYDQSFWAPNAKEVIGRYSSDSAKVRERYVPKTEQYGPREAEMLDIFAPAGAEKLPVMIFVHGGTWRLLSRSDASHPAPTFVENGCIYIALNFDNIPAVRLPEMADQCRRAVAWVAKNIAKFGGDPNKIFVSGHSSGGHLAGVLLTTDWSSWDVPADVIKGGVAMSGMYDLYPVMLSSRRKYLTISDPELAALSPMRHLDKVASNIIVIHGANESPEFKRQSNEFANALEGMGSLRARFELPVNHFEVVEALNDPASEVSKSVLQMMRG